MEPAGGMTVVRAEVPMAEILTYAQSLTSLTGGRGDYSMSFLRYEEVPSHVSQKIVDQARADREEAKAS
jgi:elongation factor G